MQARRTRVRHRLHKLATEKASYRGWRRLRRPGWPRASQWRWSRGCRCSRPCGTRDHRAPSGSWKNAWRALSGSRHWRVWRRGARWTLCDLSARRCRPSCLLGSSLAPGTRRGEQTMQSNQRGNVGVRESDYLFCSRIMQIMLRCNQSALINHCCWY